MVFLVGGLSFRMWVFVVRGFVVWCLNMGSELLLRMWRSVFLFGMMDCWVLSVMLMYVLCS